MKLYIIGNGFDLAHHIPTRYINFKEYLSDIYGGDFEGRDSILETTMTQDGDNKAVVDTVADLIRYTMSNLDDPNWNNFEDNLARIDFDSQFDFVGTEDENHPSRQYDNIEDRLEAVKTGLYEIKTLFAEWVETIDISKVKPIERLSKEITSQDLFLNFNYTETLEDVYKINTNSVCHIHGKMGSDIVVGHGDDNPYATSLHYYGTFDYGFDFAKSILRKNVDKAYKENKGFFDKVGESSISQFVFYGFSFSSIDTFYLNKVIELVRPNCKVAFTNYDFINDNIIHFLATLKKIDTDNKLLLEKYEIVF